MFNKTKSKKDKETEELANMERGVPNADFEGDDKKSKSGFVRDEDRPPNHEVIDPKPPKYESGLGDANSVDDGGESAERENLGVSQPINTIEPEEFGRENSKTLEKRDLESRLNKASPGAREEVIEKALGDAKAVLEDDAHRKADRRKEDLGKKRAAVLAAQASLKAATDALSTATGSTEFSFNGSTLISVQVSDTGEPFYDIQSYRALSAPSARQMAEWILRSADGLG